MWWRRKASAVPLPEVTPEHFNGSTRPYTRWWWLGGPFTEEGIDRQLRWFQEQGFGGVELAWLKPTWFLGDDYEPGPEWLGERWQALVGYTKRAASGLGLGCDFTFGSVWPFGGWCVEPEDASKTLRGEVGSRVSSSWEEGEPPVVSHLDREALRRYAEALGPAFGPGLEGGGSSLFCDSLEINKRTLWEPSLAEAFRARWGYDLPVERGDAEPGVRFDRRWLIGEVMVEAFYRGFTEECARLGATSRVQVHGAPVDLLVGYGAVDVPESEALLFPPHFSRIPASAAALTGKTAVSCETFTCIYGFPPRSYQYDEAVQIEDLKALADAVFAAGVNQIVWHGAPFSTEEKPQRFFASVHVGPDAPFVEHLPTFNGYLERASRVLQAGRPVCGLWVYLPYEDGIMAGDVPDGTRTPGEQDLSELRRYPVPRELEGFAPLWISTPFLERAEVRDGRVWVGELSAPAIYVDVAWMTLEGVQALASLAERGARIVWKRAPEQPGHAPREGFAEALDALGLAERVGAEWSEPAWVEGEDVPPWWGREVDGDLWLFFAHPGVRGIEFPMTPGQGDLAACSRRVTVRWAGHEVGVTLRFERSGSALVRVTSEGGVDLVELGAWRV